MGKHHLQPISLIVPIIMQMYGPSCGIATGADFSMTCLRCLVADYGPEVMMPHDITSVVAGHGALQQQGLVVVDKNLRPYQEQLAMDLENQVKCGMVMSDCGRKFGNGQRPFHWND